MKSEQLLNINNFDINNSDLDEKKKKIDKILDKYFRLPNGQHLSINYLEFKNYLLTLREVDEEEKESSYSSNQKYSRFYEQIKEADIYPGEYVPKIFNYNDLLILASVDCFIFFFTCVPLYLQGVQIYSFLLYLFGMLVIFFFVAKIGLLSIKKLDQENIVKLIKILNAKPSLELYYKQECILKIPYHSYADVTGIKCFEKKFQYEINMDSLDLNKTLFLDFPLKYLFFVDSTQQYFKFLIVQFNKYCYFESDGYNGIYRKMYLKFCLHTSDNEIIYRNDPFFFTSFTTMNLFCYYFTLVISIFTFLSPLFCYFINSICKKMIEIKKTISIKHNLEEYLDLDALFLKVITNTGVNVSRQKHEVISNKDSILNEFIEDCVKITERTKTEDQISTLEKEGKLTPFHPNIGIIKSKWSIKDFQECYGTKVEKILGMKIKTIFYNFGDVISNEFSNQEGDDFDENENDDEDDKKKHHHIKTHSKDPMEKKASLSKVIYQEKILSITCHINKQSVNCTYNIKLPRSHSQTGKFDMRKPLSNGFKNLEEKVNQDWTKSEIYIPGCEDKIIIIRKRRAIRILLEDKEIITSETQLNDEIHSGAGSWLDGNDWSKRTMDQFVKKCNKVATKNRFKTEYH